MKYLKLIPVLVFCTSIDHAIADGTLATTGVTANGYDRENFCAEGARKKVEHLNDLTKNDVSKIEALKKSINELEAKKKILGDLKSIRNNYINAFESINSEKDIASTIKNEKSNAIDKFKHLLNSNLALNAVTIIAKAPTDSKAQTIENLCDPKIYKENSNLQICKRYDNQAKKAFHNTEIANINKTLANFNEAISKISDKESIKVDIEKILSSIPESIDPNAILEVLNTKSGNLSSAIGNASSREEIFKCLNNNTGCENLISETSKRSFLGELIGKEAISVQDDFSKKMVIAKKDILEKNSKDLTDLLHSYDNPLEKRDERSRKSLNGKTDEMIATLKGRYQAIGLSESDFGELSQNCKIPEEVKGSAFKEKVTSCQATVNKILKNADATQNELDKEREKLAKELETITHNPKLEKAEKLKQFVIQRYMRGCPEAKEVKLSSNMTQVCNNLAKVNTKPSDQVENLASDFSQVVGRLQRDNAPTSTKGELGLFSKAELREYSVYCQDSSASDDSDVKEVCKKVGQYSSEIKDQKESKEWEEFHKKYYVEYNPSSKNGYDVYEKKSNGRFFAEGLGQTLYTAYPIWLNNYMLSNQIDMMTNQAIYQKQLNYMYTPTSPWMMNSPYFQGNYFGFPTTSNFNTSNPYLSTPGYNFGP